MRTVGLLAIAGATLGAGVNQWTAVGPEGGSVPYLTVDVRHPGVVFAGGYRQPTFKSTDGGLHWKATNFPAGMVVTDPNDDARLYVATTGHGLFQSTDGGASWSDSGLPDRGFVSSVTIAQDSMTVYAAVNSRIFKTVDGGANWSTTKFQAQEGGYCCTISLTVDPTDPNTVYAADESGIYKSTDGAENWTPIPAVVNSIGAVAIDRENPSMLYVIGCAGFADYDCAWSVLKSTDGGASWNPANSGLPLFAGWLGMDPQDPRTLYATGGWLSLGPIGLFKTTDGGASWSKVNAELRLDTVAIDPGHSATLYTSNGRGVLKSTDGGISWSAVNSGLIATTISALTIDPRSPDTMYAVEAETEGSSIFKSTDGGASWAAIHTGLPSMFFATGLSIDQHTGRLCTAVSAPTEQGSSFASVFTSADGGASWIPSNVGLQGPLFALALDSSSPGTAYASLGINVTGLGIYKTTNGAANWSFLAAGPIGHPGGTAVPVGLVVDPRDARTIYALSISAYYHIWKSTDGGVSFSPANAGLPTFPSGVTAPVSEFAIDPQNSGTLYAFVPKFDQPALAGGLFKSTDGGASWEGLSPGLPEGSGGLNKVAIDPRNGGTIYAGTSNGVWRSVDGGAHWSAVNSGLPMIGGVNALAIDPQTGAVYAATSGGGVFAISFAP